MIRLASLLAPAPPDVGVEIGTRHVTVVRLAAGSGPASIAALAVEPLPDGAVTPALNDTNVADRGAVSAALARAIDAAGARRRRAVLVVPDAIGKVSLLKFDKVPERREDLTELIRWQTRKSVPFRAEDGQLTFAPAGPPDSTAGEFAVVLARRDIVAEYESLCADAGVQVGVVDLATFNVINAVLAAGAPDADWLLVNAAGDYLSLAIMRGSRLLFYRHRGSEGADSLEDIVHQTAMYYEDRLSGRGFSRVVLANGWRSGDRPASGEPTPVRRQLEQRLQTRVDNVDPRPAVSLADRISVQPAILDALAPAVGLLLRERTA
ncbi:MAG TPA: pilus assembly protein PilM [Vicinamibacterales bacterium]|nr:pilus assembly protein PilM [Vicinamibacterales bacterium]